MSGEATGKVAFLLMAFGLAAISMGPTALGYMVAEPNLPDGASGLSSSG